MKRKSMIGLLAIALLAVPVTAFAEHQDDEPEDTRFSFAYDVDNHFLAINVGPNDGLYQCDYDGEPLDATFGEPDAEGVIPVDSLEVGGETKSFDPTPADELDHDLTPETDPFEYNGADDECGVSGVVVAGPNGQINHGQALKAVKNLLNMRGHGCVFRYFAQSDIGRSDETRLRTPDVDTLFTIGEDGVLTFSEAFEADCNRGKKKSGEEGTRKGRPDSPGKSGQAPGRNK